MTDDATPYNKSTSISGGVNLDAERIDIGGDVVGRDKIVSNIYTGDQQYDVHGLANPYLGLRSFTYADQAKYAGREGPIAETTARLTAPDDPLALLFVTGASGSGKSSFVQAGVLPALERHYAALSVKYAVFRPSHDPIAMLADALWRQLGLPQFDTSANFGNFLKAYTLPQQVNVIVIDQFEELFTQSAAQPRDALFTLLTHLPPFRSTRTHIIATVRADYLPELFALPALYDIAKYGIDLRAMSVDELREAIQHPLRVTYPDKDKRFQAELVERLAQDAAEDAAYLPLLQVTLEEIWRKGALTLGAYSSLSEAIEQRADKVLAYRDYDAPEPHQPRPAEEQSAILDLCLNLVDVSLDDEARRDVRRRRSKDELSGGASDRARLIDALTQARLLSVDTESDEPSRVEVDLIHETLLANWDRLRQAIAERRHELRQRVRFEQQLKEWIGQDRSDDYLLGGVRLAEARELERRDDIALHSSDARDFVRRSAAREEAQRQKELDDAQRVAAAQRRAARLLRWIVVVLALGIVGSFIGGVIAIQQANSANAQRDEAQRQTRIARVGQLVAQAQDQYDTDPQRGILLALEAWDVTSRAGERSLPAVEETLRQVLPNIDGFSLAGHESNVGAVAFSPDGRRLVTGGSSGDNTILLQSMADLTTKPALLGKYMFWSSSLSFSPDGRWLAMGSADNAVWLWDMHSSSAAPAILRGHTGRVVVTAFSPDGHWLATGGWGDKTIRLWDMTNLTAPSAVLHGHEQVIGIAAFSPDGHWLVTGSDDGVALLWKVADPTAQPVVLRGYVGSLVTAFSPDGHWLATAGCERKDGFSCVAGGTVRLWDVNNPTAEPAILHGHEGRVSTLAFSPDNRWLGTGSEDHTVGLWAMSTFPPRPIVLRGHESAIWKMVFSPDGNRLATASLDGIVRLWEVDDPTAEPVVLREPESDFVNVAFSPDGHWLVTAGCGKKDSRASCVAGSVRLWHMQLNELVALACHRAGRNLTVVEWRQYFVNEPYRPTCLDNSLGDVAEADAYALQGDLELASRAFSETVQLATQTTTNDTGLNTARLNNTICRLGSIDGFARIVMPSCERAVKLTAGTENEAPARDRRGLARALVGDYTGAIEDFGVVSEWLKEKGWYDVYNGSWRDEWIAELKRSRSPFDATTLETLRSAWGE